MVVALLMHLALAQAQNKCITKNQFLSKLASSVPIAVTIYPTSNFTAADGQCGNEWKTHGTCCDPEDLEIFFRHERMLITNEYVGKTDLASSILSNWISFISNSKTLHPLQILTQKTLGDLRKYGMNCRNALLSIRGPAFCSVCSGRSQVFFTYEKDKLLIDLSTCKKTIEDCGPFQDLYAAIKKELQAVIPKAADAVIKQNLWNYVFLLEYYEDFLKYASPPHLIEALEAIKTVTNKKLRDQASITACTLMLDITKKPFVELKDPL